MNKLKPFLLLKIVALLLFQLISKSVFAQDMTIVKKNISDLCSKEFAGRAYSNKGDSLAAFYIADILKKNKIKSFDAGYFQPFKIPVNSFPGKLSVAINDSLLIPGYDYLVASSSASIEGKFPIIVMDHNLLDYPENFKKLKEDSIMHSFLIIDTLSLKNKGFRDAASDIINFNLLGAKGIIEIENKNLLYVPSHFVQNFPKIILQRNSMLDSMKTISVSIENKFYPAYTTRNIAGFLPGSIDTFIVITAHYDHLGEMGKGIYFPGANDNASGTSMVLELARYFAKNKKKLKYSLAFIFFSAEELGLEGSSYFANNPVFPLSKIKFLVNLDMVGSGDKGIKVVNGTENKFEFERLVSINNSKSYLPDIGIRGPAANSDHYPFHQKGVKCFFIYTLGDYSEYHSIYDQANSLPLAEFEDLFKLMVDFIQSF